MYHCHIRFYLAGCRCSAFEKIKRMRPLENFTHEFTESEALSETLTANADVILAYLHDEDVSETVRKLVSDKKKTAELILITDKRELPDEALEEIKDIWQMPMSDDEMGFHFIRWQYTYKMAKDLWQTEQYLETIINSSPNLIWYKNIDGKHEKVNDSFCNTVGKTKGQVEGRDHAYIWDVDPDDPACSDSDNEVINRKQTCISEEIINTGEGMKTLTTYKSPLYDIDGSVMGTAGVAVDVTKERAYEHEILKKSRTLEKIFTTIDCGVIRHTLDGDILSINRAALKILGYETKEELMEAGFKMVAASVIDKDKKRLQDKIMTLKNEGDSVSVNYRVQHKDGEMLHVVGNIKLLKENGELVYQRFLLDCTAQKLEENKRERRHIELVHALSTDYCLVCYFDLNTGIGTPLQNDGTGGAAFDSIFSGEILMEESMNRYIREFVYEDDREMLQQALSMERLREELSEKKIYYMSYRMLIDGEPVYFQMKAVRAGVWEENQGIVLGFRSVDEETRKDMEKRDLLEEALLQANKASKAKSTFLSNMSHDIRTPMNAIVGFTNLAATHIDDKSLVEEYLGKIMTSGNHLLSLINDVLDMSRIESGKVQLEEKPCSLTDILNGLRSILQADINAKQMQLIIDTEGITNVDVCCDRLRLNQVLLNLLSNSVKYTGNGGSVSMIVIEKAGAPAGYANYEFHIRDNGIGMSEEFLSHIFEPFEREKNTTLSGVQGTGLGMAITKNIMDMMDGTIDVKSKQGEGTEFTLCLTLRLPSEAAKQPEVSKEGKAAENLKHHTGRILLAEDIELNQEVAVAILGDAGFETEVADNGQLAVDMLKKSEPGYYMLILMDIQMPVMNGYEAAKAIRRLENEKLSSIPIIAMTANAFEEDRQEALKCGMNGHIAKPIDVANLFDTLGKILG